MDPLPEFGQFKTVQTALEAAGVALNLLLLAFSIRHRVGTRLSTVMLRSQSALDSLVLLADLLSHQYVLFGFPSDSASSLEWDVYCAVVFSHLVYYSVLVMSVYNLVALSVERCLCLAAPFWYKRHSKRILAVSFCVIVASPLVAKVPHCVASHRPIKLEMGGGMIVAAVNGTSPTMSVCTPFGISHLTSLVFEMLFTLLVWALPFLAMLILYTVILVAMRRTTALSGQQDARKGATAAAKRLTIIIGVTSCLFVILLAPKTLLGLLYITDAVPMKPDFFAMALFPFMCSINSAVNPVVFFVLMPKFRRFVFCCRRRPHGPQSGSSSVGRQSTTARTGNSEF